jgi:mRNA-degrading endonuclease RelE of RelBE toxin-antitoxin system
MVKVSFDEKFERQIKKLKDSSVKEQVGKLICKIRDNPETGKPMRFSRKGTREVYAGSFRLSYAFNIERDEIILLDFYHKDEQ